METDYPDEKNSFRDSIATVNEEGKREWVFPRKPKGPYYNKRTIIAYLLLAILFAGPFIKIQGEPLLLFNILERKFVIFGQIFWPQDFFIFVVAMLTSVVFILLFTVAYGRIFCGWVCPQTIFLEMVFRKIEYWIEGDYKKQKKLAKMPMNAEKFRKKALKHFLFVLISVVIAHTFLSYIIGAEQVYELLQSNPVENIGGFSAMIVFTGLFYGVFAFFREQACIIVCPYGRLQGAMLDNKSIVVAYDFVRGEGKNGRGKFRKNEDRDALGKGDCIDCHHCVDVCPTGIDIRNGTQLECVNCTACIDACNDIMLNINKPKGLIRYASIENIEQGKKFKFTPRLIGYTAVLGFLLSLFVVMLSLRSSVEATMLRSQGTQYQEVDGTYQNLFTYKVLNKTNQDLDLTFEVDSELDAHIKLVGEVPTLLKGGSIEGVFFIQIEKSDVTEYSTDLKVNILHNGQVLETVTTSFLGPMK